MADNTRASAPRPPQSPKGKPRHRRASVALFIGLCAAVVLLLLWALVGFLLSRVSVKSFDVQNDSVYSDREIMDATGLWLGEPMFREEREVLETRILEKLPYLSDVSVRRGLGGRLRIVTESYRGLYYTRISGDYYALSEEFRVLHTAPTPDAYRQAGMLYLSFPDVRRAVLGEVIVFDPLRDPAYVGELLSALADSPFASRVSGVLIHSKYTISLVLDDKYEVKLGDSSALPTKLSTLQTLLEQELVASADGAVLDVSDPKRPGVIPGEVEIPSY